MGNAIEEGLDLHEAVEKAGLPDWKSTRLYLQNHRRNAHFIYTEMEKELF